MKLTAAGVFSFIMIAEAIRVPSSWDHHPKSRPPAMVQGSETRPYVMHQVNSNHQRQSVRHGDLEIPHYLKDKPKVYHNYYHPQLVKFPKKYQSANQNIVLIHPSTQQKATNHQPFFQKPAKQQTLIGPQENQWVQHFLNKQRLLYQQKQLHPNPTYPPNQWTQQVLNQPLTKNYRDDKTHEPDLSNHQMPEAEEEDVEEESDQEEEPFEAEVPTRPIYPGEGQWAIKGLVHRPFISQHQFEDPPEDEEKADGHELFEKNQHLFNQKNQQYYSGKDPEEIREDEESESDEFVPTRLYTQVRRSENEEHLPSDLAEEDRLREIVKDSKIQTVYTEEGYEDAAYDHAGHEKNAEEDEGYAEFDKEVEKEKLTGKEVEDNSPAGSQYSNKIPRKMKKDNFIKTEETKTTALKNDAEGNSQMEISSEIKVLAAPNNETKAHKYVKVYRYDKEPSDTSPPTEEVLPLPQSSIISLRRYTRSIDHINDALIEELAQEVEDTVQEKYPYYGNSGVNPDSPLRYSEDFDHIPKKAEDAMAFYNQADRIECPQVEEDIDPIPQHVKDAENKEETKEVENVVKKTRLNNLGDKIDCFKVKYFGENPLDSPLFQESTIAPVVPLFTVFNQKRESNEIPNSKIQEITTVQPPVLQVPKAEDNETEATITIITTPKYTIDLKPKHIYDQIELLQHLPPFNTSESVVNATVARVGKSLEEATEETNNVPQSQALRYRRRKQPQYLNRYLLPNRVKPTTSYFTTPSAILSEVHYKNEIKAEEQLNVFADVLNNIKNASMQNERNGEVVQQVNNPELDYYLTTTNSPPYPPSKRIPLHYETIQKPDESIELYKIKAKTTLPPRYEEVEEPKRVMGLMPPGPRHQTLYRPMKINHFIVLGMKPPPLQQEILLYSDYGKIAKKYKVVNGRRGKREAQRLSYSAVARNRNKPIDVQEEDAIVVEEDEDYVPHRPKNYHYDEETGRIVYDNPKEEEELEEVIEVTEASPPVLTRRVTTPKFEEDTGPSFVEYIQKLRNNPKYQSIPDPTTTEKSTEVSTSTTQKPISTNPPAFLSILAKVKNDSHYKPIEDKKSTTSTTTEAVPEEIQENVQNSPGGQTYDPKFQIFDINDYLPKIKTYTPSTAIDYSKYKTIERPMVRHNLSSRYNSEEEELSDVKTVRIPIVLPIPESTTPVSTTTKRIKIRTRTRVTRTTTIPTTTPESSTIPHVKPQRTYPRRRPGRIRIKNPTEAESKVVRRRSQPITPEPRIITPEENNNNNSTETGRNGTIEPREDVQVFNRKYDRAKKHGGNYRKEVEEEKQEEVIRLTDVVPKPFAFYSDPQLPNNVNQLVEGRSSDGPSEEEEEEEQEESVKEESEEEEQQEDSVKEETGEEEYYKVEEKKPVIIKDPSKRLYYYAPI